MWYTKYALRLIDHKLFVAGDDILVIAEKADVDNIKLAMSVISS